MPFGLAIARTALAALTLAAIGRQLTLHVGASYSVLNFFSYFTNLSNLFAALVLLSTVPGWFSSDSVPGGAIRYISAVNMAIVGLVFSTLLRNVDLGALLPWVNFVVHYVMPVAVFLDWCVAPPVSRLNARHMLVALVFPALYLVYVVLRGASTGWYPYPFLDPANVGGYGGVATYSAGIAATFLLVGWALLAVAGSRTARRMAQ